MFLCQLRNINQDIFINVLAPLLIKNYSLSFLSLTNTEWRAFLFWNFGSNAFKMCPKTLIYNSNIWNWATLNYPKLCFSKELIKFCAELNNCDGIQFLLNNKYIKFFKNNLAWTQYYLAKNKNANGILLLFKNNIVTNETFVCEHDFIQNCDFNIFFELIQYGFIPQKNTFEAACYIKNLDFVKHVYSCCQKNENDIYGKAYQNAIKNENFSVLEFLIENIDTFKIGRPLFSTSVAVIKILKQNNLPLSNFLIYYCSKENLLESAQYVLENINDIYLKDDDIFNFAQHGNIQALRWIMGTGYKISNSIIKYAASSGNISLIEFLLSNNFTLRSCALKYAIEKNQDNMVTWLLKNKCPIKSNVIDLAALQKNYFYIDLLLQYRAPVGEIFLNILYHDDPNICFGYERRLNLKMNKPGIKFFTFLRINTFLKS